MPTSRWQSRIALAALFALFVAALSMPIESSEPNTDTKVESGSGAQSSEDRSDAAMFRAVVDRMRAGEFYYPAMGTELRDGNYPTASVFNWRTPALYIGLAFMPASWQFPLMAILCLLVLIGTMVHLARHGSPEGTVLGLMLAAAAAVTVADRQGLWLTETWTGVLIGLSVVAYMRAAWLLAALLGVAALFLRELAAPYCVVCAVLALRAGRRRELAIWAAGLVLFSLYYGWHVSQVFAQRQPGDLAHPRPWLRFGGLEFWLATIGTNKALFATPRLLLAIASVLLLASLWARKLPLHVRWSVIAYGVFFAIAGQPFNDYWGFVAAFVYAIALSYGPDGLWMLGKQAVS